MPGALGTIVFAGSTGRPGTTVVIAGTAVGRRRSGPSVTNITQMHKAVHMALTVNICMSVVIAGRRELSWHTQLCGAV